MAGCVEIEEPESLDLGLDFAQDALRQVSCAAVRYIRDASGRPSSLCAIEPDVSKMGEH